MLRQAVFGRQAWIVDVKGEYDRLAEALCVQPIALSPGGPIGSTRSPRAAAPNGSSTSSTRSPRPPRATPHAEEKRAGQEAIVVLARRSGREPTLPDVVDVLVHPPAEMAEALAMDVVDIANVVRPMAFALDQLCTGNLRGMFDGPTTPGSISTRRSSCSTSVRSSTRRRQRSGS